MGILSRKMDQRIAVYQRELVETHYAEVENCTARYVAGGTTTATISRP